MEIEELNQQIDFRNSLIDIIEYEINSLSLENEQIQAILSLLKQKYNVAEQSRTEMQTEFEKLSGINRFEPNRNEKFRG